MIGSEAGEVMTVVQTAMLADLPYPRLRDAVIAHLTVAEGLGRLLSNVPPYVWNATSPQRQNGDPIAPPAQLAMLTAVLLARNGATAQGPKFSSEITGAGIS